jgi:DNA polymerase-3 subunit gamma/tau
VEITSSTSLDVLEIDGASNNGVEQVREIIEGSRYAPSRDRFKIYIIDEVHMLSTAAFNALLKTLEEPPPRVKFIFATTEYHKIPDTILSRCQQFEFRTVPSAIIGDHLRKIAQLEGIEIGDAAISQIARAAEGSLRDALSALDQVLAAVGTKIEEKDVSELLGLIDHEVLADAARAIMDRQTGAILSIVNELVRGGRDLRSFARGLIQYFRDLLVVRAAPDSPELVELAGDRQELTELSSRLSEDDLIRSIDLLTQVEGALRWAPEPRFHLEVALLKLAQLRELVSFEDLLARFEALASGSTPPPGTAGTGGAPRRAVPSPVRKKAPARASSRPTPTSRPKTQSKSPASPSTVPEATTPAAPKKKDPSTPAPTNLAGPPKDEPHELVDRIMESIRSVNPKLSALLSHHNGVSLDDECLHIGFDVDQKFFQEQLESQELRQVLEKTASECAGRPLRVAVALLDRKKESPPQPTPPSEEALREKVLKEPLVRSFLETFQGEVEEIKPLGRAPSDPEGNDQQSDRANKR